MALLDEIHVYLDMDGVLVDWYHGAVAAVGGGVLRIPDELDTPLTIQDLLPPGMSRNQMWSHINKKGESFWLDLPVYPWARPLIDACQAAAPLSILSKPSMHPSSHTGKVKWIQRMLGEDFTRYHLSHDKAGDCGRPGAILIDDYEKNVDEWRSTGGHAILFPHIGNVRFREASDPLPVVLEELTATIQALRRP